MNQPVITLLSDFGNYDVYVGVMKGVIAQINPDIKVIDLTHQIPPQDIAAGRFCLMDGYSYFPAKTVHLAVVDPGVGGKRRAIAVQYNQGFLVGPDNGLFSGVLSKTPAIAAVELTNPKYWTTEKPSTTFHGRDIFAPVAAHLASGVSLPQLGSVIDVRSLVDLDIGECIFTESTVTGSIQYIDHFGNIVTNIPGSYVEDKIWYIEIAQRRICGAKTYSDVKIGEALALIGSHNFVEIAVNRGNAQLQLNLKLKDNVKLFNYD